MLTVAVCICMQFLANVLFAADENKVKALTEQDYKNSVSKFIEAVSGSNKPDFEVRTIVSTDSPEWRAAVVYFKRGYMKQPQPFLVSRDGRSVVANMVFYDNKPVITPGELNLKPEFEKIKNKFSEEQREIINPDGTKKVFVFTDPDCPFCQQLENNLKNYHGRYKIVVKNFPLPMHGPDAKKKAIKREAGWLVKSGMNQADAEKKAAALVDADIAEGNAAEIEGTPTIVSDGGDVLMPEVFKE